MAGRFLARVCRISCDELRVRTTQAINKRLDVVRSLIRPSRVHRTLLDPSCPRGRFFFGINERQAVFSWLDEREDFKSSILEAADAACDHVFDLLGYKGLHCGTPIDWHRDPSSGKRVPLKPWYKIRFLDYSEVGDAKIIWELNRHQHLVALAKAYGLTQDSRYLRELESQWYDWQAQNPYPFGINWVSSLEVAFRLLSWLWVREILIGMPAMSSAFLDDLEQAAAISAGHIERYLSTYFSPNTHLLGEAVALFFAGLLCRTKSAQRWRRSGWQLVLEHMRQVQADGFYFEQSTYYHVYALDFFLHARILAERNDMNVPAELDATIEKMLDALAKLSAVGPPPRFGDDDGGRLFNGRRNRPEHLVDPLSIGAVCFNRSDWRALCPEPTEETVWLLPNAVIRNVDTVPFRQQVNFKSAALRSAGLYMFRDADSMCTLDAGAQGACGGGHSHSDALSLQLSVGGREVLTDAGTFAYISPGNDRQYFRGTSAHNTLQVDDVDQMVANGPFPWASFASVNINRWTEGGWFTLIDASQCGYQRLSDPVAHRRSVFHRHGKFWFIFDLAEGREVHKLKVRWRASPDLHWRLNAHAAVACESNGNPLMALLTAAAAGWQCHVDRMAHSTVYRAREEAEVLQFAYSDTLPASVPTILVTGTKASSDHGSFISLHDSDSVYAYRYTETKSVHSVFVTADRRHWEWQTLASDAQFLYYSEEQRGQKHLVICDATYIRVEGTILLSFSSPVKCWAWSNLPNQTADSICKPGALDLEKLSSLLGWPAQLASRI